MEKLEAMTIATRQGTHAIHTLSYYKNKYPRVELKYNFTHSQYFKMPDNKILYGCYHPSPRNVNTGRIDEKKMIKFSELANR